MAFIGVRSSWLMLARNWLSGHAGRLGCSARFDVRNASDVMSASCRSSASSSSVNSPPRFLIADYDQPAGRLCAIRQAVHPEIPGRCPPWQAQPRNACSRNSFREKAHRSPATEQTQEWTSSPAGFPLNAPDRPLRPRERADPKSAFRIACARAADARWKSACALLRQRFAAILPAPFVQSTAAETSASSRFRWADCATALSSLLRSTAW